MKFVEKNAHAGGRLSQLKKDGFTFDLGPSFFSMPYEFEELMRDCNMAMPFEFVELDPSIQLGSEEMISPFICIRTLICSVSNLRALSLISS